jgi:hypothetical protein
MRVIEDFCNGENGDRPQEIDFGFGEAQYKLVLGSRQWRESSSYVFAPTVKGFALNLLRTPTTLLNELATTSLVKMRLLPKVKAIWRHRAIQ